MYSQKIWIESMPDISLKPNCTRDLEYDGLRKKKSDTIIPSYIKLNLGQKKFAYYLSLLHLGFESDEL